MDGYKEEGVGERCHIIIGDEAVNAGKDICLDAEAAEEDGERLAHHIEKEWVHAKGEQSPGQDVVFLRFFWLSPVAAESVAAPLPSINCTRIPNIQDANPQVTNT